MRALIALAQLPAAASVSIAELARSQAIPKKFLEQILLDLKRQGIVQSRRGQQGGYRLLKAPAEITFGRVLRIVDGPIALLPCLSKIAYRRCEDCLDEKSCGIRRVFAEVAQSSRRILDNTTIADSATFHSTKLDSSAPTARRRRSAARAFDKPGRSPLPR